MTIIRGLLAKKCSGPKLMGIEEMLFSPKLQFAKRNYLKEETKLPEGRQHESSSHFLSLGCISDRRNLCVAVSSV
jgi:hypothetical protein